MSGLTCDTSVLIPALTSWHPRHPAAWALLSEHIAAVPGHVLLETFSVLTRLPAPQRIAPAAAGALVARTRLEPLALPASVHLEFISNAAEMGVRGGSVYDAFIAATVKHHDLTLVTLDRRARPTYDAIGVQYQLLGA